MLDQGKRVDKNGRAGGRSEAGRYGFGRTGAGLVRRGLRPVMLGVFAGILALGMAGCGPTEGQVFNGPTEARVFNIEAPAADSRFVALAGSALPDEPISSAESLNAALEAAAAAATVERIEAGATLSAARTEQARVEAEQARAAAEQAAEQAAAEQAAEQKEQATTMNENGSTTTVTQSSDGVIVRKTESPDGSISVDVDVNGAEPVDVPEVIMAEATPMAAPTSSGPAFTLPWANNNNNNNNSSSSSAENVDLDIDYGQNSGANNEEYAKANEQGFFSTQDNPLSTFSTDVDTASYANLRRMVEGGMKASEIPDGAVRIEEMLNYFDYDFIQPTEGQPFAVNAQISDCPWNEGSKLMVLGVQAQTLEETSYQGSNLVFLIDTSGSMSSSDKLPLLQDAFIYLSEQLGENDTVSIVTYAGSAGIVLDGANGSEKSEIIAAIDKLEAGGSTNGVGGMQLAYQLAAEHFIEGGNNRIIMASDGDLNVGITQTDDLHDYVSAKRSTGVYLSVLGFGTGNYKDDKMETLADNGNGNYHYIDSIDEAEKVLGEDLLANLVSIADDVKLQLEFNPEQVESYRLIGYENRKLNDEDFTDDTKDAAEMGAGHQAIVAYEVVLTDDAAAATDAIKFNEEDLEAEYGEGATLGVMTDKIGVEEWCSVALRYKPAGEAVSRGLEYSVDEAAYTSNPDKDWMFVSGLIEFGLIASNSAYTGNASFEEALARTQAATSSSPQSNTAREEFNDLLAALIDNS